MIKRCKIFLALSFFVASSHLNIHAQENIDLKASNPVFKNIMSSSSCNPDYIQYDIHVIQGLPYQFNIETQINGQIFDVLDVDIKRTNDTDIVEGGVNLWEAKQYLKNGKNTIKITLDSDNKIGETNENNNELTILYNQLDCEDTGFLCTEFDPPITIHSNYSQHTVNADAVKVGNTASNEFKSAGISFETQFTDSKLKAYYHPKRRLSKYTSLFSHGPISLRVTPDKDSVYHPKDWITVSFDEPIKNVVVSVFTPQNSNNAYFPMLAAYDKQGNQIKCTKTSPGYDEQRLSIEADEGQAIHKIAIDYSDPSVPEEISNILFERLNSEKGSQDRLLPPFSKTYFNEATSQLDDIYIAKNGLKYDAKQDRLFAKVCHALIDRTYPYLELEFRISTNNTTEYQLGEMVSGGGRLDAECKWFSSSLLTSLNHLKTSRFSNNKEYQLSAWIDSLGYATESDKQNNYQKTHFTYKVDSEALELMQNRKGSLFSDVDTTNFESSWYAQSVAMSVWEGIVRGYNDGTFRPSNAITLAEATKMILLAAGLSEPEINEVSPNQHWASHYMQVAKKFNLYDSFDYQDSQSWNKKANRLEVTKALVRAFGISNNEAEQNCFPDLRDAEICQAKKLKVIKGYDDGTFKPNKTVNRAEMVKIIFNLMFPDGVRTG